MTLWTDELSEQIARDRGVTSEATWIAWACVTLGPLTVAGAVSVLLWLSS